MKPSLRRLLMTVFIAGATTSVALADEITDWNRNMLQAAFTAGTSPLLTTRVAAIVQSAVFDAVNGIERHYTPIHVEPNAAPGASRRAAAVQAAYAALVKIYPSQKPDLDTKLAASMAAIASEEAAQNSVAIQRGVEWGQTVADAIWAWRLTDGITPPPPPFLGGNAPGQWRPTPPALAPGAGTAFVHMTPWVIQSSSQFRPAGPPALASDRYAADFNETKGMGSISSASRTTDQTLYARFWHSASGDSFWDNVAVSLARERNLTFSAKARLLALLNLAIADAGIGCFEAKYFYSFWRPVTAIPLAATDGNAGTIEDPAWTPLLVTPGFPEYPSAHACGSSAAATILADYFGESTAFVVTSDDPSMVGVTRFFPNFTAAVAEINNARVFAGIHFRSACNDGEALGTAVANYVLSHALLPAHGNKQGQLAH